VKPEERIHNLFREKSLLAGVEPGLESYGSDVITRYPSAALAVASVFGVLAVAGRGAVSLS